SVYHTHSPPHTSPLSLHDALPISASPAARREPWPGSAARSCWNAFPDSAPCRPWKTASAARCCQTPPDRRSRHPSPAGCRERLRSEEHTSELQSQSNLVCRLLLEK